MALVALFKLDETTGGLVESIGNVAEGSHVNGPTLGATGQYGNAVQYDGVDSYSESPATPILQGKTQLTICAWVKGAGADLPSGEKGLFGWYLDANNFIRVYEDFIGRIVCDVTLGGTSRKAFPSSNPNFSTFNHLLFLIDIGAATGPFFRLNKNSSSASFTGSYGASALPATGDGVFFIGYDKSLNDEHTSAAIDEVRIYDEILDTQGISDAFDGLVPSPPAQSIPVKLRNFGLTAAQSIPSRLLTQTLTAAQSIDVKLRTLDATAYNATALRWSPLLTLDGVDISADLIGQVRIEHEESASGLADFAFLPATGAIDLSDFERKPVAIDFQRRDSAGALVETSRRYTGITTRATYDPDRGIVNVSATTDLQGRLENLERSQIDAIVGGRWSEHVFDDTADGWQYARDRLSTRAAEIHVDNHGRLRVADLAAGTVDTTLTDGERFGGTLALTRVSRRDLISRVRLTMDYRFTRLRHRQVRVSFFGPSLCDFLDGKSELPTKAVIQSAADGNAWTRLSPITYDELPPTGTYCGGKNFTSNEAALSLCLGAVWDAARRWAQTVTEVYSIDVVAPDVETAIGQQRINEDYGIESVYDATDYEALTDFDAPPTDSTYNAAIRDYQLEATDAERTGRTALDNATETAIAKAQSTILERARRNVVRVENVYNPTIDLTKTVRVNTPYLQATGKVRKLVETLDLATGRPGMALELAVSRQGGAGLSVTDPVAAPTRPSQTVESPTSRTLTVGWLAGGTTGAPADSESYVGWISNAYGGTRTDPNNLYRERFVLEMPAIEQAARQATDEQAAQEFDLAVPDDELTLSR